MMTTNRRVLRAASHLLSLVVLACLSVGALLGAGPAGAVSGNAGPVAITVTPTSGVTDGQELAIHAEVPDGTVIYEIKAHLCLPNANVRSNFDFGFQGKKCSNAPVGGGDVEQTASFGEGVAAGDLGGFHVGAGSATWVNELGYNLPITCGPGQQCDVVVRVQITNGTVFFTVPLCYGTGCANVDAPPPATEPPPTSAAPPAAAGDSSTAGGASSGPVNASGGASAPGNAVGNSAAAAGPGVATKASTSHGTGGVREIAAAAAMTTSSELTLGWRVLIAAVAGAVAAADIARVVLRTRRRRTLGLGIS